jgi:hypothetical protein
VLEQQFNEQNLMVIVEELREKPLEKFYNKESKAFFK